MKHLKPLMAIVAVSFILLTSCKKDIDLDRTVTANKTSVNKSARISAELEAKIAKVRASLPAELKAKLQQPLHPEYREMVRRALAVEPTPCNDNTAMYQWLGQQLSDWNSEVINFVLDFYLLDLPTYDALVFENSSANQYFGVNGEYTQRITKTFKDLQRFWNIQSDDIVLAAMHGNMLTDRERIIRTYVAVYGLTPADAAKLADVIVEVVETTPQYRDGNHPIFTFNAFALEGFPFPPYGVIPDKIIMGDGIMEAFTAIGFGDVAPQAILAHEFAHHIQYQLNLFGEEDSPEATRRTELMADAYAAYYLSHARGAAMQWKRVQQFLAVFFNIGDCSFDSDDHHGTPTQRMAAAQWGYTLADTAQKQGHILTAQQFVKLFEERLPTLVKL